MNTYVLILNGGPSGKFRVTVEAMDDDGPPEQWQRTMFVSPSGAYEGKQLGEMLMNPADDEVMLIDTYERLFLGPARLAAGYRFLDRLELDNNGPPITLLKDGKPWLTV